MINRLLLFLCFTLFFDLTAVLSQKDLSILFLNDSKIENAYQMREEIEKEILSLVSDYHHLNFKDIYVDEKAGDTASLFDLIYKKESPDVVISTGVISSQILNKFQSYPIPSIAAINLEESYEKRAEKTKTRIENYSYIESPFNIRKDIESIIEITRPKHIAVIMDKRMNGITNNIEEILSKWFDIDFSRIDIEKDAISTLKKMGNEIDAAYLLAPLHNYSKEESIKLFEGLSKRDIPCFSLFDEPMITYGAYAAFSSNENLSRIPRKMAIQVSKILDGAKPADLDVAVSQMEKHLIINMETVRKTGIYPGWEILDHSTLVNINELNVDQKYSLQYVIAEVLENNLQLQSERKKSQMVKKDVGIARSNFMPQIELESTGLFLDENSVNSLFGTKGTFNLTGGASLTQLILSEPAMANIAIQKLLFESQKSKENQEELDLILDVSRAYFSCLQLESLCHLHNENSTVKRKNLEISKEKEMLGYSGVNDIYRWESELALSKVEFQNATAQLQAARFRLNELMNRQMDESFELLGFDLEKMGAKIFSKDLTSLIQNESDLDLFADFMVAQAMENLPELEQMEAAVAIQERMYKSKKRAFYSPSIALGATYEYPLAIVNPAEPPPIPGINISSKPSWNAAIVASIPVFTGNYRRKEKQKGQISLENTILQKDDVQNKFEWQVRSNVEQLYSAYKNLENTKRAADSGHKNLDIVQDLYASGQINITTLIDAQNVALSAEINASNALYNFMIELFELQRSTGTYKIFSSEEERSNFINLFMNYKTSLIK